MKIFSTETLTPELQGLSYEENFQSRINEDGNFFRLHSIDRERRAILAKVNLDVFQR